MIHDIGRLSNLPRTLSNKRLAAYVIVLTHHQTRLWFDIVRLSYRPHTPSNKRLWLDIGRLSPRPYTSSNKRLWFDIGRLSHRSHTWVA